MKSLKLLVKRSPEYSIPAAADKPAPAPITIKSASSIAFLALSNLNTKRSILITEQ